MSHLFADLFSKVNKPNKPSESASSKKWIARDSSPHLAAGTFFGLIGFIVAMSVSCLFAPNDTYATDYTYSIIYDDNVVSNMPTDVNDGKATGGSLSLANNTPSRSGYSFLGWCNTSPSSSSGTDACSGTTYQPSAGITIASATNFHLYAMWGPLKDISTATYMQEVGDCPSTLTTGQVYSIKDSRDEKSYNVAKLADGKCWMTSNLNLAGGTALDADKTDVDSSYISSFTTSNNLTKSGDTIVLPASSTSGFNTNNYSYVYNSGNNTTTCTSSQPCNSYYSWDAATLGSGRSITTDNTDAEYSICPKGWHLPNTRTGTDDTSDFRALMIAYGGSAAVQTYNSSTSPTGATMYGNIGPATTTPNFLLAGYYSNGQFSSGGSNGYYWSATSYNSTYARYLGFGSSDVASANGSLRNLGFSVRCVFGE